ncbi:Photosystem I reaction center subunit VI-2 [Nymphaea thermarum]|nr:Photosystem I reaction center subunit VI-2 [Nymphaea thermarum]
MAALATTAVTAQPAAVKGLGNTSLYGVRVPAARVNLPKSRQQRSGSLRTVAKYGEKSVYFDLDDLGNTTGSWDLYGSDAPSPYNPLQASLFYLALSHVALKIENCFGGGLIYCFGHMQSKFFETFAAPFTKRGLLLKFLILGGGSSLAYLSSTATGDILPIKKGPQLPPKLGPRGKI